MAKDEESVLIGDTSDQGAYKEMLLIAKSAASGLVGCTKLAAIPAVPPHPVTKAVACVVGFIGASGLSVLATGAAIEGWNSLQNTFNPDASLSGHGLYSAKIPTKSKNTVIS